MDGPSQATASTTARGQNIVDGSVNRFTDLCSAGSVQALLHMDYVSAASSHNPGRHIELS